MARYRKSMSRRGNKKSFRRGLRTNKRNHNSGRTTNRGGIRL